MTRAPVSPEPGPRVALRIGIDQTLEGAVSAGYAGRILDITPGRAAEERRSKPLVVAVGYQASTSTEVGAGTYLVEAISPSGTMLEEVVHICGDEGSVDVRLAGEDGSLPDRPGLRWQLLSGNVASAAAPVAQAWRRHRERADRDVERHRLLLKQLLGPRLGAILLPLAGFGIILLAWRWSGWGVFGVESRGGWVETVAYDPVSWLLLLIVLPVLLIVVKFDRDLEKERARAALEARIGPADGTATASVVLFTAPPGTNAARQLEMAAKIAGAADGADADLPIVRLSPRQIEEGYWQCSVSAESLPEVARTGERGSRFLIVRALDGSTHMVALPLPWESVDGTGPRSADVLIGGPASPVSTTVADPRFATLLGYLSAGQMTEARLLAGEASDLLRDKLLNPYAAAAGAYALLSADDTHQRQPWREWVANLNAGFPHLPDGAVLQGWNLLQMAESDAAIAEARSCFLEAAERGIPVFAEGVKRLAHGLSMFIGEDPDGRVKAASAAVEQLAIRCHPQQPFTTLRLGGLG